MDVWLLKLAALVYLIAAASFIAYLFSPNTSLSRRAPWVLFFGFLLHSAALGVHFFLAGFLNVAQFREAVTVYCWLMVASYLIVQIKYHLTVLGAIIAPLALIMTLAAFAFGTGREQLPPALQTYWLPVHVILAFLGNAAFAVAFAVSLIYVLLENKLKQKKFTAFMKRVPALETLDRLNYVLLVWGFPLMTLGIITGSLWAGVQWGEYWSWEPRQIASGLAWLFYAALLHGRITAGLRGKKAALLTMIGFCVVLGYFLLGDTLFPGRHAGRFE